MSDKRNSRNDAFDLLNREFAHLDLERENARNLEAIKRKQAIQQRQQTSVNNNRFIEEDEEVEEETGGSGCMGSALRIFLILILAGALAWIVFMPQGSLEELMNKIYPQITEFTSWVTDQFSGGNSSGNPSDHFKDTSNTDVSSDVRDTRKDETASTTQAGNSTTASTAASKTATASTTRTPAKQDNNSAETGDISYSITVYRQSQIVVVYDSSGNPAKVFTCSSGKSSTPTKLGEYSIRAKYRWRFMVGNCYTQYASSFSNGYLFHSIPYNKKNPGTMSNSSYDKLGNPASSGCIRLCFRDTKWIYDNCPIGTNISVIDEKAPAGLNPEIIPARIDDSAHSGWDPTDDSPDSPYNK